MKLVVILLICTGVITAIDDLDSAIDEVFNTNNNPVHSNQGNVDNTGKSTVNCECVAYYLCQNNTIITDGVGLIDIRVQDGPCENYLDVCCEKPLDPQDKITPAPITHNRGCGYRNPEGVGFRITGDENGEAQFGEFPWMVAVLKEEYHEQDKLNIYQCGGALIHPQVVLTAGHCVPPASENAKLKVRAGEWDTQTVNELYPHQDAYVESAVVHPRFHSGALYYDYALLFLTTPMTLAENIGVACLPQQADNFDYSQCYASGWGKNVFGKEGKHQVIMKKVELPVVPHQQCQDALRLTRLGPYYKLHESFLCAGGEPGKDTCRGDGGSPLMCPVQKNPLRYAQAGIVAWGIGCGEHGTPGVYANVAYVRNWIDDQFHRYNVDSKSYQY